MPTVGFPGACFPDVMHVCHAHLHTGGWGSWVASLFSVILAPSFITPLTLPLYSMTLIHIFYKPSVARSTYFPSCIFSFPTYTLSKWSIKCYREMEGIYNTEEMRVTFRFLIKAQGTFNSRVTLRSWRDASVKKVFGAWATSPVFDSQHSHKKPDLLSQH